VASTRIVAPKIILPEVVILQYEKHAEHCSLIALPSLTSKCRGKFPAFERGYTRKVREHSSASNHFGMNDPKIY